MNVKEFAKELDLKVLSMPSGDREILTGYAGDLLSWVMGKAPGDCAWFTIMSNVNIVAVAMLRDVSAVVVCEGAQIDEDIIERAKEQDINLLLTEKGAYEMCVALSKLI